MGSKELAINDTGNKRLDAVEMWCWKRVKKIS